MVYVIMHYTEDVGLVMRPFLRLVAISGNQKLVSRFSTAFCGRETFYLSPLIFVKIAQSKKS